MLREVVNPPDLLVERDQRTEGLVHWLNKEGEESHLMAQARERDMSARGKSKGQEEEANA